MPDVDTTFWAYLITQPETGFAVFVLAFVMGVAVVSLLAGLAR